MNASSIPQRIKERDSGVELFRIIAMLSIVAHHYVVNSGVMSLLGGTTIRDFFYYLFGMWGKTGINCFVLITGYFMCQSSITLRKFLKLFLEVVFYKITIYVIFACTGYYTLFPNIFIDFWPISSVTTGFVSCFLLFYLCIPFLNILIKNLSLKLHALLLLLVLFIYTFMGSIPYFQVSMNYVTWFCILYLTASFMRLYATRIPLLNNTNWGILSIISITLSISSVILLAWFKQTAYFFVSDSNKILALSTAFCTFMYFKNLKLHYSKFINTIAASTFGVLLIHAHSNEMRLWLWKDFVNVKFHYQIDHYILFSFSVVIAIFTICIIIDNIRIRTIEKYTFRKLDHLFSSCCYY